MPRPAVRDLVTPYAVAWAYLAGVTVCGVAYLLLPRPGQAAVLRWTSTNVHNLHQDPVGCLITSAFFPSGSVGAWPLLIALALFGALVPLMGTMRVLTRTLGLARAFPFTEQELRRAALASASARERLRRPATKRWCAPTSSRRSAAACSRR